MDGEEVRMPFESGHKKRGGRKAGTLNKVSGEARQVARRLLGDAEYQRSLQNRLIRGEAPRIELHLWELAFGRPRGEPDQAPDGAGASAGLVQLLEQLGESKTQDPSAHRAASPGTNQRDTEEELS
jgi:hypothetical protein